MGRVVNRMALAVCLAAGPVALVGQAPPAGPPTPLAPDALFTVACATSTLEAGPVYAADDGPFVPRSRAELAGFIDQSIIREATGGCP